MWELDEWNLMRSESQKGVVISHKKVKRSIADKKVRITVLQMLLFKYSFSPRMLSRDRTVETCTFFFFSPNRAKNHFFFILFVLLRFFLFCFFVRFGLFLLTFNSLCLLIIFITAVSFHLPKVRVAHSRKFSHCTYCTRLRCMVRNPHIGSSLPFIRFSWFTRPIFFVEFYRNFWNFITSNVNYIRKCFRSAVHLLGKLSKSNIEPSLLLHPLLFFVSSRTTCHQINQQDDFFLSRKKLARLARFFDFRIINSSLPKYSMPFYRVSQSFTLVNWKRDDDKARKVNRLFLFEQNIPRRNVTSKSAVPLIIEIRFLWCQYFSIGAQGSHENLFIPGPVLSQGHWNFHFLRDMHFKRTNFENCAEKSW